MSQSNIIGCILGTALGDSIGLPYEGVPEPRLERLLGQPDRHRFLFRRGMTSDDTEHTIMVAQSLISSGCSTEEFAKSFSMRLRYWLLRLPAGIGMATIRSIVRLWIGYSPERSGVFSAGNGPAMRAAIIGAAINDDSLIRELVKASSIITHSDSKAEFAAFAVAIAAKMARENDIIAPEEYASVLRQKLGQEGAELLAKLDEVIESVKQGQPTTEFADSKNMTFGRSKKGVSGYAYNSVPIAIHAWLSHQHDFRGAIISIVRCGGDTDSTAAILGGIIGTSVGENGLPTDWIEGLIEWPCNVEFTKKLGRQLFESVESESRLTPFELPVFGLLIRNVLFLAVVLFHGFRRLFPPY